MKTIEEIIAYHPFYAVKMDKRMTHYFLGLENAKDFLSIVIGEEERECQMPNHYGGLCPTHVCPECHATGKIKHPVTIRDAIAERIKK